MAAARKSKNKVTVEGHADPRAPLDIGTLLGVLKPALELLEADLLERIEQSPAILRALRAEYEHLVSRRLLGDDFETWRQDTVLQVAAAWVLSCIFVRTLEDRDLLGQRRIAGPGALDSERQFFDLAPSLNERDYLITIFRELTRFPATEPLFDADRNPVWLLAPSKGAAKELLAIFRTPSADSPSLRFGQADTRFLGDLYQDLSAHVRKKYALLQTPHFVEDFILDRTLSRSLERFGVDETSIIDPTCGSGHFLVGAFHRLLDHRLRTSPSLDIREAARLSLTSIAGTDINPYAVAIARFRLTLAFMERCGYSKIAGTPQPPLNLAVADSLLYNRKFAQRELAGIRERTADDSARRATSLENEAAAEKILFREYTAVVGNPPYITPTDPAKDARYRAGYRSPKGKYSLVVPFIERFVHLTRDGGFFGALVSDTFTKRDFGDRLIEEFLPSTNVTQIVNCAALQLPGHGSTRTLMLFGTGAPPSADAVTVFLAKKGASGSPDRCDESPVWRTIVHHADDVGYEDPFGRVARVARDDLAKWPWRLGGDPLEELAERITAAAGGVIDDIDESVGVDTITRASELVELGEEDYRRLGVESDVLRAYVRGEELRDWHTAPTVCLPVPYDAESWALQPIERWPGLTRFFWPHRRWLAHRWVSGGTRMSDVKLPYWALPQMPKEKHATSSFIAWAFVATHNHFVFLEGPYFHKQSAPIIKLPRSASPEEHLFLVAYLNSSLACALMKRSAQPKTVSAGAKVLQPDPDKIALEFPASIIKKLPLPPKRHIDLMVTAASKMRGFADERLRCVQRAADAIRGDQHDELVRLEAADAELAERMVAIQEIIDLLTYDLFNMVPAELVARAVEVARAGLANPVRIKRAERACEGGGQSAVGLLLKELIARSEDVAVIETPAFKRRWIGVQGRFRATGLSFRDKASQLAEVRRDRQLEVLFREHGGIARVKDVVPNSPADEAARADRIAVPYLAAWRFNDEGLRKHEKWLESHFSSSAERVDIEPLLYVDKDYRSPSFWKLRNELDVPRERLVSFPGCESDSDRQPVFAWAGWNHLQRALALATLYQARKSEEAWAKDRLTPMLAGILELLPWVKQWHTEASDEYGGETPGTYLEGFIDGECASLGLTRDDLRNWRPPLKTRARAVKAEDGGEPKPKKRTRKKTATEDEAKE